MTAEHLPMTVSTAPRHTGTATTSSPTLAFPSSGVDLGAIGRQWIERALAEARHNKSQAAKLLDLPRGQLYSLMKRHGLPDAKR